MNPTSENGPSSVVAYAILVGVQVIGAVLFIWKELPAFNQLLRLPGRQLPSVIHDDFTMIGVLLMMQAAYWYRLKRIPLPSPNPNVALNHVLLFLGRLSFIFGGALFSVVFFRHLPELDQNADPLLMARGGIMLGGSLFALFCLALELERLGRAFETGSGI